MRKSKALIAGIAGLVCAGGVYAAAQNVHVLKVAMPDGSIARIHYVGDVAPKVEIAPAPMPVAMIAPDFDAPFAMLDRVAAEMDRQQAEMLQQAATQLPPAQGGRIQTASDAASPQSVYHYTYISSTSGNGGCTQSYALTSYGDKQAPKEVSSQSGDCKGVTPLVKASVAAPAMPATPMPAVAPKPARISRDSI